MTSAEARQGIPGHRFVMVIDLAKCDGCAKCTQVCQKMHFTPPDREWITMITCGGEFTPLTPGGPGSYGSRVVVVAAPRWPGVPANSENSLLISGLTAISAGVRLLTPGARTVGSAP